MKPILIKNLIKAHNKLTSEIGKIENQLVSFMPNEVNDGFGIFYQPSDGFVLEFDSHNIPLCIVLDELNRTGKLSYDFLMRGRI